MSTELRRELIDILGLDADAVDAEIIARIESLTTFQRNVERLTHGGR